MKDDSILLLQKGLSEKKIALDGMSKLSEYSNEEELDEITRNRLVAIDPFI